MVLNCGCGTWLCDSSLIWWEIAHKCSWCNHNQGRKSSKNLDVATTNCFLKRLYGAYICFSFQQKNSIVFHLVALFFLALVGVDWGLVLLLFLSMLLLPSYVENIRSCFTALVVHLDLNSVLWRKGDSHFLFFICFCLFCWGIQRSGESSCKDDSPCTWSGC